MDFKTFQINLMPSISNSFQEDFVCSPNIIGSSEIGMGLRSNVIFKRFNIKKDQTIEMLAGKIMEYPLKKQKLLYYITKEINKSLGYTEKEINNNRFIELTNNKYLKFSIKEDKSKFVEILPGKLFRYTPDIDTSLYNIEIKTTGRPKNQWGDLAPYNIMQLNANMGFLHHEFGFLFKIDLNFIKSKSESWDFIWNRYILFYPTNFNPTLFNYTIERVKYFFSLMDTEQNLGSIMCPEHIFECEDKCRKYCPNPIDKVKVKVNEICAHCKQEIRADTTLLIRNDQTFHYTSEKGHIYEQCVNACKNSYRTKDIQ